jgi:hypothetical protein
LKDDKQWLSDTPVTFCLLFVLFLIARVESISKVNRDCFQDCAQQNIWGNRKIKLLDTTFWQQLSQDPDRYRDGFRKKNNLLEYDFVVMPMFDM